MKFKEYLREKVIKHDKSLVNNLIRDFVGIVDSYIKDKEENVFHEDEVYEIIKDFNSKYFDVYGVGFDGNTLYSTIYFGIINGHWRDNSYIEIDIQVEDFTELLGYYAEDKNDAQWETFLKNLKEVILHELVHAEQSYRRPEGVDKPETFQKLAKRFGDLVYYNKKDEIMAHAGGVIKQLLNRGYKKDKIKEMIINTREYQNELMVKSDSYENFYRALSKNNPKLWKRFLKYVYQYLEEEL